MALRLSKKQSQLLAFATLIAFFLFAILFFRQSKDTPPEVPSPPPATGKTGKPPETQSSEVPLTPLTSLRTPTPKAPLPEEALPASSTSETPAPQGTAVPFRLDEFHRSEIRNGKKIWEVRAKSGSLLPDSQQVLVQEAKLTNFGKEGKNTIIETREATLALKEGALAKAFLVGDVKLVYDSRVTILTEEAQYVRSNDTVTSPKKVVILADALTTEGIGLTAHLTEKTFTLDRNVSTIIEPQRKKKRSGESL